MKMAGIQVSGTVRRAIAHIIVGLSICIAAYALPREVMLVVLGAVTFVSLLLDMVRLQNKNINARFSHIFRWFLRDYEASRLTGASFLLVASMVTFTVFSREIAVMAITFLALGDPFATLIGERFGKIRLFKKNVEGVATCFLVCAAAGSIWRYIGLDIPLGIVLTGTVGATIAESLPVQVDDNLTIPLLSGTLMWLAHFVI